MPLSDDFTNSRLQYLQLQMKNNQNTTQQFYPRFQRAYNEMFPFTEGSIKNALNPQAQVIMDNIPQPDDSIIEDSLKQKINELTRNTALTDTIFNKLKPEERYYYDRNFELVPKELLKKIKMPTSQEEFSLNLAMILNNDNNRNNVLGIKNYMFPPAAAPAAAPAPEPQPAPHPAPPPAGGRGSRNRSGGGNFVRAAAGGGEE